MIIDNFFKNETPYNTFNFWDKVLLVNTNTSNATNQDTTNQDTTNQDTTTDYEFKKRLKIKSNRSKRLQYNTERAQDIKNNRDKR